MPQPRVRQFRPIVAKPCATFLLHCSNSWIWQGSHSNSAVAGRCLYGLRVFVVIVPLDSYAESSDRNSYYCSRVTVKAIDADKKWKKRNYSCVCACVCTRYQYVGKSAILLPTPSPFLSFGPLHHHPHPHALFSLYLRLPPHSTLFALFWFFVTLFHSFPLFPTLLFKHLWPLTTGTTTATIALDC